MANVKILKYKIYNWQVDKGTLVEFRLHGDRRLAVADRPDGKKIGCW
jgi:hypothetical protein